MTSEFCRILGMTFQEVTSETHPLGQAIRAMLNYTNLGQLEQRNLQQVRLQSLLQDLQIIERYNTDILDQFTTKLRHITSENYFGERLEIRTTAVLINKKVIFKKNEAPDFVIDGKYSDSFVECGSIHLYRQALKNKDPLNKLAYVIRKKSKKIYCNHKTALFIDFTNIHSNTAESTMTKEDLVNYVHENLKSSNYGSVLLFAYRLELNTNRYYSAYIRIDNNGIDHNLLNFLNDVFPLGNLTIDTSLIPEQG